MARPLIRRKYLSLLIIIVSLFLILIYGKAIYNVIIFTHPLQHVKKIVREIEMKGSSESTIINSKPGTISFLKTTNKCKWLPKSNQSKLLIAVKSYVGNFEQRLAIRQTWGKTADKRIQVIFVVGCQGYTHPLLQHEDELYQDIVQGSFKDTYNNNIFKTMATYQWIVQFCIDVDYVLLTDDDYFVNVDNLVNYIGAEGYSISKDVMYGYRITWRRPFRTPESKWYVPNDEYSNLFWPPYLLGGAILTNIDVVKKINVAFPYVKHVHIDDAYIGIVANLLEISLKHDNRFSVNYVAPEEMDTYFASHQYGERRSLINGWNKFTSNGLKNSPKTSDN